MGRFLAGAATILLLGAIPAASDGAPLAARPGALAGSPWMIPARLRFDLRLAGSLGGEDSLLLVGRRGEDPLAPFRAAITPYGVPIERTAGIEWLHGSDWQLEAGYASSRPPRRLRLDALAPDPGRYDIRSTQGMRLGGEWLGRGLPFQMGVEGRLERIRIEDDALVGAGTHVPEARIALVLKRPW